MQKQPSSQASTSQRLATILKSARDVMRKDKGMNGEIDRLPMLTWLLFLKFIGDSERLAEEEAELVGRTHRPIIQSPYRWQDWGARGSSLTGAELIAFVSQDEAKGLDGVQRPGLLAHLRSIQSIGGESREEVIANVFKGVVNRMESGYLLREVLTLVDSIHFDSTEEVHTLSHLYESLLREMRDAAGDSGEFYTPRPLVRFLVASVDPRLGELVLDPACGTGGFLVEAYTHLAQQASTVETFEVLQKHSVEGQEAKSLPYMLAQMNLLLHGVDYPDVRYGNTLGTRISEIGDAERADVILTNPPFGGEEEASIKSNFPAGMQTSETSLLFLQYIMRKLRRRSGSGSGGRAAVIVPNGLLFSEGVAARIKQQLVTDFNLHTVVRLPNGVFAPYTPIPTNVLFFERSISPTKGVWFYELQPPDGRKNYTKTKPLQFSEFEECLAWMRAGDNRLESDAAWYVPIEEILQLDEAGTAIACNFDQRNPNSTDVLTHRHPSELLREATELEVEILELLREIQAELEK